jgi:hypothetical protein
MKTLESSATERLAEWEAATLPRALECFRKMIQGDKRRNDKRRRKLCYEKELGRCLAETQDEKTALFLFYKTVLNTEERKSFFEMFQEVLLTNKNQEVDNLATLCGADLDIAQFFQINLERAEMDAAQKEIDLARRRNHLGVRRLLRRLDKTTD